ncbi:MAG: HAMP domain-containing protein [Clostridia bacterium]|nr:HAMP domain-containing protein [Clostridia bacterium]
MRRKSIYKQLFTAVIALFAASFILTGTLLFYFLGNYLTAHQEEKLDNIARQMIDTTMYLASAGQRVPADTYRMYINALAESTDTEILILNKDGRLVMSSVENFNGTVKEKYIEDISKGKGGTYRDSLEGVFRGDALTVTRPIEYQGTVIGGVLVSIPTPEVTKMRIEVLKVFALNVAVVTMLVAFIVYFISKRITKPLSVLRDAAKSIADGDFKRRVYIEADSELTELGETFNHMANSLEQLENMRSSFIANVSHDLRTPMTTIIGFVEGILDGTIPPDKHAWYLSVVLDESKRLSRIVTDLLDLSKLEQGSFSVEKRVFDMNELIRLSIIKFEKRITEKNIRLMVGFEGENLRVNADKDAVQRVLTNLLDNAIKFTQEGGFIDIQTGVKENRAYVSIQNSGAGIEKKDLMHIFDRFYKTDKSRGQDKNGAGLGLYIVKSILQAHGEQIWAESEVGEFTRFSFTLEQATEKKKLEEKKAEEL